MRVSPPNGTCAAVGAMCGDGGNRVGVSASAGTATVSVTAATAAAVLTTAPGRGEPM
jgi:hypothetical protein